MPKLILGVIVARGKSVLYFQNGTASDVQGLMKYALNHISLMDNLRSIRTEQGEFHVMIDAEVKFIALTPHDYESAKAFKFLQEVQQACTRDIVEQMRLSMAIKAFSGAKTAVVQTLEQQAALKDGIEDKVTEILVRYNGRLGAMGSQRHMSFVDSGGGGRDHAQRAEMVFRAAPEDVATVDVPLYKKREAEAEERRRRMEEGEVAVGDEETPLKDWADCVLL